jgi:Membrane bound FAD containing D-sorbitol dehydrogenase
MISPPLAKASRRDVLAGFAAIAASSLFPRIGAAADAPGLPPLEPGQAVGEEQFLALSQWLTARAALNHSVAQALRSALLDVGLGDQLVLLYRAGTALQAKRADGGVAMTTALQQANVLDIATTVLRGWYVGLVRQPDGKDRTVAYEQTLMAAVVADFLTLPTFCSGIPNYWAEPPKVADLPIETGARP